LHVPRAEGNIDHRQAPVPEGDGVWRSQGDYIPDYGGGVLDRPVMGDDDTHLTWKYRLKPTPARSESLCAILKEDRELYNAALEERQTLYGRAVRKHGPSRHWKEPGVRPEGVTGFDQMKSLTEIGRDDPERKAGHVAGRRGRLFRLDRAYRAACRRIREGRRPGFPKFWGKRFWKTMAKIAEIGPKIPPDQRKCRTRDDRRGFSRLPRQSCPVRYSG